VTASVEAFEFRREPTLTFLGAAGTVTGAKFLLAADGTVS